MDQEIVALGGKAAFVIETAVQMVKQMQYFEENRYNLTLVNDYIVIMHTILL